MQESVTKNRPLIEELLSSGVMQMGASRVDPSRQVGTFNPSFAAGLPLLRAAEMEKFRWIAGDWEFENTVPATPISPAYTDVGRARYTFDAKGEWVCMAAPDGALTPLITFDPFSRQWIYVLTRGAYGMLRSTEGWSDNAIAFEGIMTMLGPTREWRLTCRRNGDDLFSYLNEENLGGVWTHIDEWRFTRQR